MKKIVVASFFILSSIASFGQANTYFHDRIDTTIFAVADTVGHGSNNYYAINTTADFNVKQYENGLAVNLFFKKGNTGPATLTLITKTGTLLKKKIRRSGGNPLVSGDIPDSTNLILTYFNGNFRIEGVMLPVGGMFWSLTGNSGTSAPTNHIGSNDSVFVDLVSNYNGIPPSGSFYFGGHGRLRLYQNGRIEIVQGVHNIFMGNGSGQNALYNNIFGDTHHGDFNCVVGDSAGKSITQGFQNSFFGAEAGEYCDSCSYNTFIGIDAGLHQTKGQFNTYMGRDAASANRDGSYNTCIGSNAMYTEGNTPMQTWNASYVTAIGNLACASDSNASGGHNTGVGVSALQNNTAQDNVAVGENSLLGNITGTANTSVGYNSAITNQTHSNNTSMGFNAMNLANGDNNGAFGRYALGGGAASGGSNNAFGYNALYGTSTGAENTAIGHTAGQSVTTGSGNIFLGAETGGASAATSSYGIYLGYLAHDGGNYGRGVVIGYNAVNTATNQFVTGSPDIEFSDYYFGRGVTCNSFGSDITLHQSSILAGNSNTSVNTNFVIAAGAGTGTGVGGDIVFKTAPAGGSGTSVNALAEAMRINSALNLLLTKALANGSYANNAAASAALGTAGAVYYTDTGGEYILKITHP